MDTVIPNAGNMSITSEFVPIPIPPAAEPKALSASTVPAEQTMKKFSDPIDQMAWEAYKEIEPDYSEANRQLAELE